MARHFAIVAYLTTAIGFVACSAPGPVLPEVSGEPASPVAYEMEVISHRFKHNIAAFLNIQDGGRTELWQLSMSDEGKIHMFQYIGRSFGSANPVFRAEKCFLYAKDMPDSDLVPLEVFTCDHLAIQLQPGNCQDCKVTALPSYSEDVTEASTFLTGKHLNSIPAGRYIGKKMDAFSDHTQVWYWGLQRDTMPAAGTVTSGGKVRTVLDGFVQVEPGDGSERISIPLPEPDNSLF